MFGLWVDCQGFGVSSSLPKRGKMCWILAQNSSTEKSKEALSGFPIAEMQDATLEVILSEEDMRQRTLMLLKRVGLS